MGDGPTFNGWWFGPRVGGDQVWAYNPDKSSQQPPTTGWKVPWDGPTDPLLHLTLVSRPPVPAQIVSTAAPLTASQLVVPALATPARLEHASSELRREELRKRREAEHMQRQIEQAAVLTVRKAIQQLRVSTPETFEKARQDLVTAQLNNMERMGGEAQKVMDEATKVMILIQERMDELKARRLEMEKKKEEAAEKLKEEREHMEALLQECREDIDDAENKIADASDVGRFCLCPLEGASIEAVLKAADDTEKAAIEATDFLNLVSKTMQEKRKEIGSSHQALALLRDDLRPLYSRLAVCRRTVERLEDAARISRERVRRKTESQNGAGKEAPVEEPNRRIGVEEENDVKKAKLRPPEEAIEQNPIAAEAPSETILEVNVPSALEKPIALVEQLADGMRDEVVADPVPSADAPLEAS